MNNKETWDIVDADCIGNVSIFIVLILFCLS